MSKPTFSLLHSTFGRPAKAIAAMNMAFTRASNPREIEYIFAVNSDDPTLDELRFLASENCITKTGFMPIIMVGDYKGSAAAWDAAAKKCSGLILIQQQDDLEVPRDWDGMLVEWLDGANTDAEWWKRTPIAVTVRDGYRTDALLCTAICNRARYEQVGEFLHAGYKSVFSDDDFSIRAYADEADGKCAVIRTDLEFRHENPYHTGAPHDSTLLRENSAEAYAIGGSLFIERNAGLVMRGFKTWN